MSISQNYPIVNPSLSLDFANTKVLDSRVTFARASTAVAYDGQTVAKAEENLLINSQSTSWIASPVGVTSTNNSTTAPDGTTTAFTLTQDGATSGHYVRINPIAATLGTYTASIFLKASTVQYMTLSCTDGGGQLGCATVDLTAGTITQTGGGIYVASTISNVGIGWYRVSVTVTFSIALNAGLYVWVSQNSTGTPVYGSYGLESFAGTSGNLSYVWGIQLEARSTVTAYTPTTTQPITNYIPTLLTAPANVARFDHNPISTESLGFLVEEQRTNLFTYSEDFSNASWAKTNSTITSNTIVAPDGTLTGGKIVSNNSTTATGVSKNITATATAYTATYFVKYAGTQFVQLLWAGVSGTYANFDLVNGIVTAGIYTSATITDIGNNFYRISLTSTLVAGTVGSNLWLQNTGTAPRAASYTGDGYSGIYIWGAQLEAGAFPTSYIKTQASQVTRASDSASMVGSNFSEWYRADEGTIYVEANSNRPLNNFLSLVDIGVGNVTTNRNTIAINNNFISAASITNGVAGLAAETVNTRTAGVAFKGAYSAKDNSMLACLNGGVVATDITGSFLKTVDNMKLGVRNDFGVPLNGWISKVSYYPIAITSTQLQSLTS